jgi:hypothetical protein
MPEDIPEDPNTPPNVGEEAPPSEDPPVQKKADVGFLSLFVGIFLGSFFQILSMNHVDLDWRWSVLAYGILIVGFVWTFVTHGVPHLSTPIKTIGSSVIIVGFCLLASVGVHSQYIFQHSPPRPPPTDTNILGAVKELGQGLSGLKSSFIMGDTNRPKFDIVINGQQFDSATKGDAIASFVALPSSREIRIAAINNGGMTAINPHLDIELPIESEYLIDSDNPALRLIPHPATVRSTGTIVKGLYYYTSHIPDSVAVGSSHTWNLAISTNCPPPSYSRNQLEKWGYRFERETPPGWRMTAIPFEIQAYSDNSANYTVSGTFMFTDDNQTNTQHAP